MQTLRVVASRIYSGNGGFGRGGEGVLGFDLGFGCWGFRRWVMRRSRQNGSVLVPDVALGLEHGALRLYEAEPVSSWCFHDQPGADILEAYGT